MSNLKYLLKDEDLHYIENISLEGTFDSVYKEFVSYFMNKRFLKKEIYDYKLYLDAEESLSKGNKFLLLVESAENKLYDGVLWDNINVEYIGNMDYLYTVPLWDWWINPLFERNIHRGKNKSIIIVDDYFNISNIEKILKNEGFLISESYDLKSNKSEVNLFYDYLMNLLPMKLAYDLKRVSYSIRQSSPEKIYFVLRGGFFIKEFFMNLKTEYFFLDPENYTLSGENFLVIDDCIGSARTVKKLHLDKYRNVFFSSLNNTLPSEVYETFFPNINFFLSDSLLNVYSCRLFEENPRIVGADYFGRGIVFYNNVVRKKFIFKIKRFIRESDLESKIYNLAKRVISHVA